MGFLRFSTKNTFVEVDVSNIDGSSKDARKVQSWGGPAPSPLVLDDFSTDCSDEEILSETDDWDNENAARLTTAFYDEDVEACEIQIAVAQPRENTLTHVNTLVQPASGFFVPCPFVITPMLVAPQANMAGLAEKVTAGNQGWKDGEAVETVDNAWTCRMIRNIPNDYTRDNFMDLLNVHNIAYNFVYLPMDWNKAANLGYAFVNLVSHEEALRTAQVLNGFTEWQVQSQKVCDVVWGKPNLQSLQRITDKFRNNAIMHSDVPDTFKPVLFVDGHRVPFPAPTVALQKPRGSK